LKTASSTRKSKFQNKLWDRGKLYLLKEGEELSVGELLYGLMLRSGNDAACALAIHVAGSVENFAEIMNIRAQAMKLTDSHFTNPSGLHDDNHYNDGLRPCRYRVRGDEICGIP
jgi:D-alanyl-D-alanine carboxypeptidase